MGDEGTKDKFSTTSNNSSNYNHDGKIFRYSKINMIHSYRNENKHKSHKNIILEDIDDSGDKTSATEFGKQLIIASKDGDQNAVQDLLTRGAPFTTDWLGMSALHFAAVNNHFEICELLIRGGISKDGRTKVDRTPLHLAVYEGNEAIVQLLLERKCDPNVRDMLRMTPLHWAVEKGHKSIVRLLLKYGADVACNSKFEKTPICIAIESGQLDLLDELNAAKEMQTLQNYYYTTEQETNQAISSISMGSNNDDNIDETTAVTTDTNQDEFILPVLSKKPSSPSSSSPAALSGSLKRSAANDNITNNSAEDDEETNLNHTEHIFEDSRQTAALELLKSHGISMLPPDDPALSLITAIKSGRKLVVSEAGKLVLNETKAKPQYSLQQQQKSHNINKSSSSSGYDELKENLNTRELKLNLKTEDFTMEKDNDKSSSVVIVKKGKGNSSNSTKNVKIISMDTFNKMYGKEPLSSVMKKMRAENDDKKKHFITKITRVSQNNQTEQQSKRIKPVKILNKEAPEKIIKKNSIHATVEIEEDDLPPNIEMCIDSDTDCDSSSIIPSTTRQYPEYKNEHEHADYDDEHTQISESEIVIEEAGHDDDDDDLTSLSAEDHQHDEGRNHHSTLLLSSPSPPPKQLRSINKFFLYKLSTNSANGSSSSSNYHNSSALRTNAINAKTNLTLEKQQQKQINTTNTSTNNNDSRLRKVSATKFASYRNNNIKRGSVHQNAIPLLDIPEICRELYDLRKLTEDLKKSNEEYRLRIEKLESERFEA